MLFVKRPHPIDQQVGNLLGGLDPVSYWALFSGQDIRREQQEERRIGHLGLIVTEFGSDSGT